MRDNAKLGAVEVARLLHRSVFAVKSLAKRQRISLRQTGSRRGSVLGQPRGMSLRADLREDLVSGRVSAEVVAQRMRIDHAAELCPACGHRPVEVASSGWCTKCHKDRLVEAHFREVEKLSAQRALWASRQTLKRTRDLYAGS